MPNLGNPVVGYETGRNGTFNITDLYIYKGKDEVGIFGIGTSGVIINGGLSVKKEVLLKHLKEQGII